MARKVKPREPLSRSRVLTAAVALADTEGLGALSMRRLGEALGVEAMSLYKHVANKEDLLGGIVDLVVGEMALPAIGGDWRAAMRRRAITAHAVLRRHPWATMLIVSRANVGPASLAYVDATIGCLRAAGFSWALADHAWNAIDSLVYGFTLQQLNFPFAPEDYARMAEHFLPTLPAGAYPHLRGLSQEVIDRRHDGMHALEFGLDLLLDGLERLLPPAPARGDDHPL